MTLLSLVCYIADAAVIATYAVLARGHAVRPFHWANALGGPPVIASELLVGAWTVLPLTLFFCTLGWYGLWQTRPRTFP